MCQCRHLRWAGEQKNMSLHTLGPNVKKGPGQATKKQGGQFYKKKMSEECFTYKKRIELQVDYNIKHIVYLETHIKNFFYIETHIKKLFLYDDIHKKDSFLCCILCSDWQIIVADTDLNLLEWCLN